MYAKSQVTIDAILTSAAELFVSRSYDTVSLTDIAEAAGVTKGAVYHHFDSKSDLYVRMMDWYYTQIAAKLTAATPSTGTARERLIAFTSTFLCQPHYQQRMMQLVRRDGNRLGQVERENLVRAYQRTLTHPIESMIREGIERGEIRSLDARLLSWQYVAIVEVGLSDYARQILGPPKQMATLLTDLFFDGMKQEQSHMPIESSA